MVHCGYPLDNFAFVHIDVLNRLLGKEEMAHETLIYLDHIDNLDTTLVQLKTAFPDLLVQSYKEISPEMSLFEEQIGMAGQLYMVIFMLAQHVWLFREMYYKMCIGRWTAYVLRKMSIQMYV